VPFGYCVCGYAAASKQIVFTNTVDDLHQIRYPGMQGHGHYSVPLCQADRVLGVLTLYLEEGHRQAPEEVEFLNMFASALVGMIARNQATERVQRLLAEKRQLNQRLIALQEQEYRHLARELHDEIGQSVAAIKTEAALLPQQSGNELQRGIQAISSVADHIYETMHAMVRRLRPGTLDDLGLLAAIEAQVNEWKRQRPTLACSLDSHGRFDDLDDTTTITIYRFVQECLTNIVRHAAATEVKISLKRIIGAAGGSERGSVEICVSDNGRGADLARMQERGGRFGLLGMRERVEGLGGTLVIEGGPGRGLKLCARIPVLERRKG
jgi:signal transduction histidine kinase